MGESGGKALVSVEARASKLMAALFALNVAGESLSGKNAVVSLAQKEKQ